MIASCLIILYHFDWDLRHHFLQLLWHIYDARMGEPMYISTDKMVEHLVDCAVVEVIVNPRVGVPPHRGQKRQEEEEEVVMMSHFDAPCLSLSQPSLVFLLSSLAVGPAGLPMEKWVSI